MPTLIAHIIDLLASSGSLAKCVEFTQSVGSWTTVADAANFLSKLVG